MMNPEDDRMVCSASGAVADRDEATAAEFVSTEAQSDDDVIEPTEDANFEDKPTANDVVCEECGHTEAGTASNRPAPPTNRRRAF